VLTEGWDHQPTSCVLLLRPSSYKSTMIQMIGRGLRKVEPSRYPGVVKDDCIVIDYGTSILTHGSIEQDVDLEGSGTKHCPECDAQVPYQMRDCAICGFAWPRDESGALVAPGAGGDDAPRTRDGLAEFVLTEVDLLADSPFRYETLFDGLVRSHPAWTHGRRSSTSAMCGMPIGGAKDVGIAHLADQGDRLLAMAAADDFLREHGDATGANKAKRWLSEPMTAKQMELLRLQPMQALGITKYRATCLIQWKWSEKAIRRLLEGAAVRMAA
jgi:DNA repair protein RadD